MRLESKLEAEVGVIERSSSLYDKVRSSELGKDLKGSSLGSCAVSSALQDEREGRERG